MIIIIIVITSFEQRKVCEVCLFGRALAALLVCSDFSGFFSLAPSSPLSLYPPLFRSVTFALVRETCGKFYLPILWRAVCPKDFLPRHVARCKLISSSAAAIAAARRQQVRIMKCFWPKKTIKVYGT